MVVVTGICIYPYPKKLPPKYPRTKTYYPTVQAIEVPTPGVTSAVRIKKVKPINKWDDETFIFSNSLANIDAHRDF